MLSDSERRGGRLLDIRVPESHRIWDVPFEERLMALVGVNAHFVPPNGCQRRPAGHMGRGAQCKSFPADGPLARLRQCGRIPGSPISISPTRTRFRDTRNLPIGRCPNSRVIPIGRSRKWIYHRILLKLLAQIDTFEVGVAVRLFLEGGFSVAPDRKAMSRHQSRPTVGNGGIDADCRVLACRRGAGL
jgi:hypothetical protein